MGKKKTPLEKQLELSLRRIAEARAHAEAHPEVKFNSLGERLKALDQANLPDALAGDEAFEEEVDDQPSDWWD